MVSKAHSKFGFGGKNISKKPIGEVINLEKGACFNSYALFKVCRGIDWTDNLLTLVDDQ
jgi:hypothetical protein